MADINPTEASVKPGTNAQKQRVTLGATVTQGMCVYLDTSDNEYKIADCTTSTTTAAVVGIALTSGADGQPGVIQTDGYVTFGTDLTANTIYVLSTAGMMAPAADFSAVTDYLTVIGCAVSTSSLKLGINATGSGKTG
jgi:hypothetical protein